MDQLLLITIGILAVGFTIWKVYKMFTTQDCDCCSGNCSACKTEIKA
ncbi:MAG: hypothetical protein KAX49_17180 [Halanaerobiales bacterium]|nr:hypothetical protein [Halanaerobiales bacterium]